MEAVFYESQGETLCSYSTAWSAVLFTEAIVSKQKQDCIMSTWSIGFLWFPYVYNFSKSILTKNLDSDAFFAI